MRYAKWCYRVQVNLAAFFVVVCGLQSTAQGDGQTMSPSVLDPTIFTKDFYPILAWDVYHGNKQTIDTHKHGLASVQECNFNIGGFVLPRDLPECERLGLKVLVAPDVHDLGTWARPWKKLSDQEIDARIKAFVESAGNSPAVAGFFLADEPGASHFPALGKVVAAVKKYAPGKLAYINLLPGYATASATGKSQLQTASFTEYLERYVAEVKPQFISYDDYQVQYSNDLEDKQRVAIYFNDLLEVRRVAKKYDLPYWNIVASVQIRPYTTIPSPANLRFQAYTTLAAGYSGLAWYRYYGQGYGYAPIDKDEAKNVTWNYLQAVNLEVKTLGPMINRLTSTGIFFTEPALVPNVPTLPGKVITSVECDAPLMVGEFVHEDGMPYAMIVNLSLSKSVKLIPKHNGVAIEGVYFSAQDGRPLPIDYKHGLWVVAGQGVLIRPK